MGVWGLVGADGGFMGRGLVCEGPGGLEMVGVGFLGATR